MQGLRIHRHNPHLDQAPPQPQAATALAAAPLSMDSEELAEKGMAMLMTENPVVIFTRPSCCMCLVMKSLLSSIGVHPAVVELDNGEMESLSLATSPAVFIGGELFGGVESLVNLHLRGHLVPKLIEVGALCWTPQD